MKTAFTRKCRQVLNDPILRHWLLRRMLGLEKPPPAFNSEFPPYLEPARMKNTKVQAPNRVNFPDSGPFVSPKNPITIELPGISVTLSPDSPESLFYREYVDLETKLAAHRFAWVPLAGPDINPNWVAAIWKVWAQKYGSSRTGWPWHTYTVAERAINIIDFAERFGVPGHRAEMLTLLVAHAEEIRNNLEYFGEHNTSNHLSNNGRGLLRIGVALGIKEYAADGAEIMISEAGRIFGRSGILKEGSSHYHLLVTRNYIDAWITAERGNLEQAAALEIIAERAVSVIPGLCLPGGMPLIGDISPDAPPAFFSALTQLENNGPSWPSVISKKHRRFVDDVVSRVAPSPLAQLAQDGWHRFGTKGWTILTYVSPDGWLPMPGHGHQDQCSFELHDGSVPIIVDPGRGSYADGDYEGAAFHNGVMIDGQEPAPVNRPYYRDTYRRRIISRPPNFKRTATGGILCFYGFSRLKGIEVFEREWRFSGQQLKIIDRIDGSQNHEIERRYFTSAIVELVDEGVTLRANGRQWLVTAETSAKLEPATRWTAYGSGHPGQIIIFRQIQKLPYEGTTVIERL